MNHHERLTKKVLRKRAKAYPIKGVSKMKKKALIRAMQLHEGYTDCFARIEDCRVSDCFYRTLCQK